MLKTHFVSDGFFENGVRAGHPGDELTLKLVVPDIGNEDVADVGLGGGSKVAAVCKLRKCRVVVLHWGPVVRNSIAHVRSLWKMDSRLCMKSHKNISLGQMSGIRW